MIWDLAVVLLSPVVAVGLLMALFLFIVNR